jgi:hypothetical protein
MLVGKDSKINSSKSTAQSSKHPPIKELHIKVCKYQVQA